MYTVNPIDSMLDNLDTGVNAATNNLQMNLDQITQEAQNGMINPATMLQVQEQMNMYSTFINMYSALVKQYGDMDKSIAQNIGA